MRRVVIPLHAPANAYNIVLSTLRVGNGLLPGDRDILASVVAKLEGATAKNGNVVLLVTDEEAEAAARHIAVYGEGFEQKFCLLFAEAPTVDVDEPSQWSP